MDNDKRVVFEVVKLNKDALKRLKKLEEEGILKKVNITKEGKLDKRMVKK